MTGRSLEFDLGYLVKARSRERHFLRSHLDRVMILKLRLGIFGSRGIGWDRAGTDPVVVELADKSTSVYSVTVGDSAKP